MGMEIATKKQVMLKIWRHAKDSRLFDKNDHRYIQCDEELKSVFGRDTIHCFACVEGLKNHMNDSGTTSSKKSTNLQGKSSFLALR